MRSLIKEKLREKALRKKDLVARDVLLNVRLTPAEKETVILSAERRGISVSDLVRDSLNHYIGL